MKALILTLSLLACISAEATLRIATNKLEKRSGPLDGSRYCRAVPNSDFAHCISFADGIARDNANAFFGNPPDSAPYKLEAPTVTFAEDEYELSEDRKTLTTIKGSAVSGIALTLIPRVPAN